MSLEQASLNKKQPAKKQAEELFLAHGDFLMSILLKDLQEQDALDIFQSLYLNIATKGIPEDIKNVRGYLYRAAINDIIDLKRKNTAYQKNINRYSQRRKNAEVANDPAEKLMRFNLVMKAFEIIEKHLSPSIHRVFAEKFLRNLNHQQIAKKYNIDKNTVDRYLSVGIKNIQELQGQFFGDPNE